MNGKKIFIDSNIFLNLFGADKKSPAHAGLLVQIARTTIQHAFDISNKYGYGFWDSLILSSAIENGCDTLYSEDMQNGQVIEKTITIVNPFSSQ